MTIDKYLERMKSVIDDLPNETEKAILSNMDEISDILRNEQMLKQNEDGQGQKLGMYARDYKKEPFDDIRGYPKVKGGFFNLLKTGSFFDSIYIVKSTRKFSYKIVSNAEHLKDILKRTNRTEAKLLSLQEKNVILADNIIKKHIDKWILSRL
jgi:hypothetical protein